MKRYQIVLIVMATIVVLEIAGGLIYYGIKKSQEEQDRFTLEYTIDVYPNENGNTTFILPILVSSHDGSSYIENASDILIVKGRGNVTLINGPEGGIRLETDVGTTIQFSMKVKGDLDPTTVMAVPFGLEGRLGKDNASVSIYSQTSCNMTINLEQSFFENNRLILHNEYEAKDELYEGWARYPFLPVVEDPVP